MIAIDKIPLDKDVYCFELDDVLYPKKDYLLQVYYLFANFIAFTEGLDSTQDMVEFMKKVYFHQSEDRVFPLTQETFGFDKKYRENFERLQVNAQLPLKLLLFEEVERLLLSLHHNRKKITILTKGNPVGQLNKLKHIDWGEFDNYKDSLKVYFIDELRFRNLEPIKYVAEDFGVPISQINII